MIIFEQLFLVHIYIYLWQCINSYNDIRCLVDFQNCEGFGQVSYEESGEFFFLPYGQEDVEGGSRINVGDQVTFFVSRDKR